MNWPATTDISFSRQRRSVSRFVLAIATLLIVSFSSDALLEGASPIPTQTIHTSKPRFRIPFRYDPAELRRISATQLVLYVSNDRGIKWRKSQSVAPEDGRFTFTAPNDGEYWFAVRTLSKDGSISPAGNTVEPGLRVVVDTSPPQLFLALRQTRPGWVQLSWNANDTYLDTTKLRLQYKQADGPEWKPLSIVPQAEGQTQWSIPKGGNVAVRGTASDFAGNVGRADMQTSIGPAQDIIPKPNVPDFNKPVASSPPRSREGTSPRRFPGSSNGTAPNFKTVTPPSINQRRPLTKVPQQRDGFVTATQPLGTRWKNDGQKKEGDHVPSQTEQLGESNVPFRVVNSREFSIGYKIDDVGPSGVSVVEVFITEDKGDSWRKYGVDGDRKSPVRVKVPAEGTYGLAMRVRSGVGLSSDPPLSGENPDIMVVVDTTAPHLRLLPLQQGQGAANNQILIHWEATDKNFGKQPISLFYSGTVDGPWLPITGALTNTGRHLWTVERGVPSKLYIRIKAQDTAGNAQMAATSHPVLVDLSRPRARIVDIEPESNSKPR